MSKALDGVRILDFTHVQSGPTCTQLLGWFGADVIKVEKAGAGDITREQLRDIPNVDSLYFTMLNHNKRSVTLDTKSESGKQVLEKLVKYCDVLVENFAPGALDRMGFTWERIHELNPRMIVASVKGFGPGHTDSDVTVYFTKADVMSLGDIFWNGVYPFIDSDTGGSIDGMIRLVNASLEHVTDKTIIIPGHGPVGNRAQLIEFRDMLVAIRENVARLKQQGKSLDEVISAKPTAAYDAKWGGFVIDPAFFTRLVYASL